jgi:hypothetical protein
LQPPTTLHLVGAAPTLNAMVPDPVHPGAALQDVFSGGTADLASLVATGPALVYVYRDECPATRVSAAVLPRFAAIEGLAVVSISQDAPAEAREFARRSGWIGDVRSLVEAAPWPTSVALGIRVTPTWLLLDRGGELVARAEGWAREDANGLAARAAGLCGVAAPLVSTPGGSEPAWQPG